MAITQGKRRKDRARLSNAIPKNVNPGDYWKVINGEDGKPEWWCNTPNDLIGRLKNHTVEEHTDKTISVVSNLQRDGHQNSILIQQGGAVNKSWHGWIKHGVWGESMQELNATVPDAN